MHHWDAAPHAAYRTNIRLRPTRVEYMPGPVSKSARVRDQVVKDEDGSPLHGKRLQGSGQGEPRERETSEWLGVLELQGG